jgi:GAF domain-containing protein
VSDDRMEDGSLAEQLGRLVQALTTAGRTVLPGSADALLRSIVQAAAKIFGAGAASILLVDEAAGMLEFKVAYGASNRELVGTRIPLDQGIAGYVAMTGQPIAISNVEQDARFNRDFARSTGYVPRSILATPLLAGERVLGVMEVLDKVDAPAFGMQDMELLGLFAQQAALAIDQAQSFEHLDRALLLGLRQLALSDPGLLPHDLLTALESAPGGGSQDDLLELAGLLNEFSRLGEAERKMCLKILSAVGDYGRSLRHTMRRAGWA